MVQAMLAHSYLAIFIILISRLTFKESRSVIRASVRNTYSVAACSSVGYSTLVVLQTVSDSMAL